jgi:FkbM family methyltransferase
MAKFVIEIGANSGGSSHAQEFIDTGSNVILIEPQPKEFGLLLNRYKNYNNVFCINAAIAEVDGARLLYGHPHDGDGTTTGNAGSSLHPIPGSLFNIPVKTITCETLNKFVRLDLVDLLIVDTEGYDYRVIKQFFDLDVRPKKIITENMIGHHYMDTNEESLKRQLLTDNGYLLKEDNGHDLFYELR